ncbi:MAG: YfbR-like 5'-deoxynucleotidase [Candidatus Hodarchaeales archaeon]
MAEHSYFVAYYAMLGAMMMGLSVEEALRCALFHDLPECITGDIPSFFKPILNVPEENIYKEFGIENDFSENIQKLVEFCDLLELKIYLEEERKSGNWHLYDVERYTYTKLYNFDIDHNVKRFFLSRLEYCIPLYKTSLEGYQWNI